MTATYPDVLLPMAAEGAEHPLEGVTEAVGEGRETAQRAGATADLAFVALYEQGYHRLVAQLSAVTGDVAEAEDVVQEAYVRAAQRWEKLRDYDAPEAWVRRVAVNLALSSLRRASRSAKAMLRWGHTLEPGTARSPEERGVERLSLLTALRRLPLHYRAVLALHYLADLDVRSIATELSLPEATVKTRLSRGRARLRKLLESMNDGDAS